MKPPGKLWLARLLLTAAQSWDWLRDLGWTRDRAVLGAATATWLAASRIYRRPVVACCGAVVLSLSTVVPLSLYAQFATVPPPAGFGGQLVSELVPYQPNTQFLAPLPPPPIYLEGGPELCPQVDLYATEGIEGPPPVTVVESQIPPGFRKGLFQKVFISGSYLPQFDNDSLGIHDLEAGIVFGLPFFRVTAPLIITPRFQVHDFDRPIFPDLPRRVYDAEVSFRHLRKFGNGPWAMNAAVTLGHYSDFEQSDADAFRVTGQAFGVYESSSAAKWIFGVVYLNREDISLVPAVGVIYQPSPVVKYEAILPRPRISWRLPGDPLGGKRERWCYVAGEFGGGIWSIERPATLTPDLLTYRDFRVLVGLESKNTGGLNHRLEAGYVFGREFEFSSATPDVRLDDSLFLRAGLTY